MTMKKMSCKLNKPDGSICGISIDFDTETRKAFVAATGEPHIHERTKKTEWTKKEFKPVEKDLIISALSSRVDELEKNQEKQWETIKALVKELSFRKGTEL